MSRTFLKSLFALIILSLAAVNFAFSDSDGKFTTASKLPTNARKFLSQHYATEPVISVKKNIDEDRDYEVILKNGANIEFNHNGDLLEIENTQLNQQFPASIIALLPAPVMTYIKDNYPGTHPVSISRGSRTWEVRISDKNLELVFDKKGKYKGVDQ